jgi:lipopolysaccharide transport system ATP-binding protein
MLAFRKMGKTLVIVSHETKPLLELCDRGLWLDNGRIERLGAVADVIEAYETRAGVIEWNGAGG